MNKKIVEVGQEAQKALDNFQKAANDLISHALNELKINNFPAFQKLDKMLKAGHGTLALAMISNRPQVQVDFVPFEGEDTINIYTVKLLDDLNVSDGVIYN